MSARPPEGDEELAVAPEPATPPSGSSPGADEPARTARPWPPPGPDTTWWRDDGAPRPFIPSGDTPASAGPPPNGATTPRVISEPPPVISAAPASGIYRAEAPSPRQAPQRRTIEPAIAESAILDAEIVEDEQPAIEASPARRSSNAGPEGFPTRQIRHVRPVAVAEPDGSAESEPPDGAWPTAGPRATATRRIDQPVRVTRRRSPRGPRRPVAGLAGLLIFAFLGAFLSWFAVSPIWLTAGHGTRGVATVIDCPVGGMSRRCADFVASDRTFTSYVALLGPDSINTTPGAQMPARVVNRDAATAYAGDDASLYLRWVPNVILTLLCGLGLAWSSGAFRLARRRARIVVTLGSLLAPMVLLAGMLAFAY